MSILDYKINNIINSSGIDFYNEEVKRDLNSRNINVDIIGEINKIWNNIRSDSRIAIYGAGHHTTQLFKIIDFRSKNIVCIVDNLKPEGEFLKYKIINKEHMKDYNIDVVFISTLGYAEEIKEDVIKEFPNIKIIDLYGELKKIGYNTDHMFYYEVDFEIYRYMYEVRNIYENENSEKYLSNLIYIYLKNRDFLYAYKYIDEYIKKGYIQSKLFKTLRYKLDRLINSVKDKINEQRNKNGLIFILDSLRWKDIYKNDDMKFIKCISRDSINCYNAYTHVPYTSMSILSILSENKLFEDRLVDEKLPIKDQGIFERVNFIKYNFKYYGNQFQFFEEEMYSNSNIKNMTNLFWEYICDIYENKQNNGNVSIIHIMELHSPYIAGNHTKRPINWQWFGYKNLNKSEIFTQNQQRSEALKYIDEQFEYYYGIINSNTSLIITSDHGNIVYGSNSSNNDNLYVDDVIKIPYIIKDNSVSYKKEEYLISHLDTSRIICNLVQKKEVFEGVEKKEFVEINRDFTYSRFNIEKINNAKKLYLGRAYKCFRSQTEKYVILSDGEEGFYMMPNEDENLINKGEYKQRVEEIKSKINNKLPGFREKRYKYTREIYDKYVLESKY